MNSRGAAAVLAALLLSAACSGSAAAVTRRLCRRVGLVRANFRGDCIPVTAGIVYLAAVVPGWAALLLAGVPARSVTARFLWVGLAFGLLGLADDLWGKGGVRGFGGHLRAMASGQLTTGALKLIGGGLAALAAACSLHAARPGDNPLTTLTDALVIALCANAVNLLDLRPGRAQAAFVLLLAPSAAAALLVCRGTRILPPLLLLGAVIRGWAADAGGRVMMGDTGANLLGATAGLAAAELLPPAGRFALAAVLLTVNAAAERVSLSRRIAETPWLAALDQRLGVR